LQSVFTRVKNNLPRRQLGRLVRSLKPPCCRRNSLIQLVNNSDRNGEGKGIYQCQLHGLELNIWANGEVAMDGESLPTIRWELVMRIISSMQCFLYRINIIDMLDLIFAPTAILDLLFATRQRGESRVPGDFFFSRTLYVDGLHEIYIVYMRIASRIVGRRGFGFFKQCASESPPFTKFTQICLGETTHTNKFVIPLYAVFISPISNRGAPLAHG
jgi:hypothetical protein